MKIETHGNNHRLNDLYIMPETYAERIKIVNYLIDNRISYTWSYANIKGHEWYGKKFIEIPFGESYKDDIQAAIAKAEGGR